MAVIAAADPASCSKSRQMPPQNETGANLRTPLTSCQVATLQAWLDEPLVTQIASRGRHRPDRNGTVPDAAVQLMTRSGFSVGLLGPFALTLLPLAGGCQRGRSGHRRPRRRSSRARRTADGSSSAALRAAAARPRDRTPPSRSGRAGRCRTFVLPACPIPTATTRRPRAWSSIGSPVCIWQRNLPEKFYTFEDAAATVRRARSRGPSRLETSVPHRAGLAPRHDANSAVDRHGRVPQHADRLVLDLFARPPTIPAPPGTSISTLDIRRQTT